MNAAEIWQRIEREARETALDALTAIEQTPLEIGALIAWTEHAHGKTDGLSQIHRAAIADGSHPETYCGEKIPPAICRLTLTPALLRTMPSCKWCGIAYTRAVRGESA